MRSKGVWLRGYGVGAQILGELLQRDISSEHDTTASCHRSLDQCDDDRVPSVVTITSRSRMSIRKKNTRDGRDGLSSAPASQPRLVSNTTGIRLQVRGSILSRALQAG